MSERTRRTLSDELKAETARVAGGATAVTKDPRLYVAHILERADRSA